MRALPTFDYLMHECIHSENLVRNFNLNCDCNVIAERLPDLVNNVNQLTGTERVEISLWIDYIINFFYLPIIYTNNFTQPYSQQVFFE